MSKKPQSSVPAIRTQRVVDATARLAPMVAGARVGDSLESFASGMGGASDKMANVTWVLRELTDLSIMAAYRGDWIAAKCIDIPAFDATREWRSWQATPDEITKIEELERRLGLQTKLEEALIKARAFGGSIMVMGVAQGGSMDPLDVEKITADQFLFVHVLGKHEVQPGQPIRDILSPWFGEPEHYQYNTADGVHLMIHPSRVIRFDGVRRIDLQQQAQSLWGDSVLQRIQDAVLSTNTVGHAIGQLVLESKMDVVSIPGLSEQIADPEYEGLVRSRFALANQVKGLYHMLLIDKEEEWNRHSSNFSGLDSIMNAYLVIAAGAADIPVTRFIGQSPAGLNSTGESDIRNYYDRVKTEQSLRITPKLTRLDEVLLRSALGQRDEQIFYEWNPLWQLDAKEKAEVATKLSTVFKQDLDAGLFPDVVMFEARANQIIETGLYPGFEQILDDYAAEVEEHLTEPDTAPPPAANNNNNQFGSAKPGDPDDVDFDEGDGSELAARDALFERMRTTRRGRYDRRNLKKLRPKTAKQLVADAKPRTLYMWRKVLNHAEITKWAQEQGFTNLVDGESMHVTIAYSKQPVDWIKVGEDWAGSESERGILTIKEGGPRVIEQFGEATVLAFASYRLHSRHRDVEYAGGSWDHEDYNPHITLSWNQYDAINRDMKPYTGKIVLGVEQFEEIDPNWEQRTVKERKV